MQRTASIIGIALALATISTIATITASAAPPCDCAEASLRNGWCRPCVVGYVAGVPIKSAMLFEALDAHGHDIDPDSISCSPCRRALDTDGFCAKCRVGYVKKQLYFSELTYIMARGTPRDPAKITCTPCRGRAQAAMRRGPLADAAGWCKAERAGTVGNVQFKDRKDFDRARRQYALLARAVKASKRCEYCAVAIFTRGACPDHGRSVDEG